MQMQIVQNDALYIVMQLFPSDGPGDAFSFYRELLVHCKTNRTQNFDKINFKDVVWCCLQ